MSLPVFPRDILPTELRFRLMPNSGFNKAKNNVAEVWKHPGAYWMFSGQWNNARYSNARRLDNFIAKLEGSAGEFMMWDSTHQQLGDWNGVLVVDGANQSGTQLLIRGAVPNELIAPEGDRFQANNYLYRLAQDAVADSSGRCTLSIYPQIITVLNDGEPLITDDPMCKMMLQDNNQGLDTTRRRLVISNFSLGGFMSVRSG